jgi:CheY-like chemotaxis protein
VKGPVHAVSSRRILVVDDDLFNLYALRAVLETDGHVVTIADSGQAGIDAFIAAELTDAPFEVVITDLGMRHIDGRKVAAAVKSARQDTPVLLLTGWAERILSEGDLPPNVDRVLSKPPKLQELRKLLCSLRAPGAS